MIDSGYAITLFDRIGRQVVDILWLPSLEALLLGVLVWALLQANRDCTPRVRHFLWVLVLVKPLLTVVAPWQGPFEIPWAPAVLGGGPAPGDHYALGSFIYAGAGLAWIAIAGLGLVRTIPAFVAMTRRSRRAVPVTVPRVRELFDSCLAELGVKKAISLRISDEFAGPVLIALGRPVVLIPSWCILELSNAELRQVLLHELAHYARRDHLTVLLVHFSRIFFFFHPTVRYAAHRIDIEAEKACDVDVVRVSRQPERYASTLLKVAGSRVRTHWHVALELARSASLVALRIRDVLGSAVNHERGARFSLLIMAFCALLAVMPLFRPAVHTTVGMDAVTLTSDLPGPVNLRQIDPASIPLDRGGSIPAAAVSRVESVPGPIDRGADPRSMIDGRPRMRNTMAAMMNKPYVQRLDGMLESVEDPKINPAVLGLSSALTMLDRPATMERNPGQGRIEVQGVGHTGNELFRPRTVSLSAGYFVTPIHQFGGVFSIRRPNDTEALDDTRQPSEIPFGGNLIRARKLAGFGASASLPGTAFEAQEEEQVDQITRIGAFYRYNLPVLGSSFTPFFGCGTGLEIKPQNGHQTIVDAGVGLRYFWARQVAVIVQAAYRKELYVPSQPHPEMSLGFSAIF